MIDLDQLGHWLHQNAEVMAIIKSYAPYQERKSLWKREARLLMEALLGDEPLYRLAEHTVVLDAGRGEFEIDGIVSQVWPLEVSE